jgi:hypothetical protein
MNKIVIYTKTYKGDLERVKVLIDSIKKYNKDGIPFYISIPKSDEFLFKTNIDVDYVKIVYDEDIVDIPAQNWYTQQIVKSSFWKLGLCENYVMIDSDSYFIKDFYISDFMYDDNTPYTVMHEQKDLFEWSSRYTQHIGHNPKNGFMEDRKKVMQVFNRKGRYFDFGPGPVIWSSKVWKGLETVLINNNKTFTDLIAHTPSEFSWYGEFLLKNRVIDIIPIEPVFKFFHFKPQYDFYKQMGYTEEILAENYMGIVMQSNWGSLLKY